MFDKKIGILQFIQKVMKEDAFSDAIKESFVLLKVLIDAFKGRMSHYVVQIKVWDVCFIVYAITLSELQLESTNYQESMKSYD